jgi:branched-chain amino acid transport system substrate-binding protein
LISYYRFICAGIIFKEVNDMKKHGLIMVIPILVVIMLIVGCAPQAAAPGSLAASQIIKIGGMWPLSGPGAAWGLPCKNVMQFQTDQYNNAGGIDVGGQKYRMEIIFEDTKYAPSVARSAAEKLVNQDKVKYVMGPLSGGEMNAIKNLFNEQKIINFEVNNAIDCVGPDKPYCFRPFIGIGELSYSLLKYFKDTYGIKTIQLVIDDGESARSGVVDDEISCNNLGIKMYETQYFPPDAKDFYPVMTKVLLNNPDIIEIGGGVGAQASQLKTLKALGYKGLVYTSTPTPAFALLLTSWDKAVIEGYFNTTFLTEGPMALPGVVKFKQDWESKNVLWITAGGPIGVGAANFLPLLVQGLQAAGTVDDADKVKVALEQLKYNSPILGQCEWGGKERYGIDHVLLYPVNLNVIKDGTEVGVAVFQPKDLKPIVRSK